MTDRPTSTAGRLARLGFADPARAERLLADRALAGIVDPLEDVFDDGLVGALGRVPDPDLALLAVVRAARGATPRRAAPRRLCGPAAPCATRCSPSSGRRPRSATTSPRHPDALAALSTRAGPTTRTASAPRCSPPSAPTRRTPNPSPACPCRGRSTRCASATAACCSASPAATSSPRTRRPPSPTSPATSPTSPAPPLEAALAIARADLPAGARAVPARRHRHGQVRRPRAQLRQRRRRRSTSPSLSRAAATSRPPSPPARGSPPAWPGPARRPRRRARCGRSTRRCGRRASAGPLVRTLASHVAYYRRWAATWEFQALLKARPVAGDAALGEAYLEAIRPLVWRGGRAASTSSRTCRRCAAGSRSTSRPRRPAASSSSAPAGCATSSSASSCSSSCTAAIDPRLRTGNTLEALEALAAYGYVGRDDAAELDRAYRTLRALEHRIQLHRLRRTHLVPDRPRGPAAARARDAADPRPGRASSRSSGTGTRREVRRLHEKLFYRPLLAAVARLTTDEARLTPEAARARLAALGYRDPAGALRHLQALTSGVSRRAAIQRQLLPVLLGWFADGADPDAGLLAFRRLSEDLGTTHWYLKMLRDSGAAAERMAHVLSSSRLRRRSCSRRAPEAVAMLGDDAELVPRARAPCTLGAVRGAAERHRDDPDAAALRRAGRAAPRDWSGPRSPTSPAWSTWTPSGRRSPTPPSRPSTAGCARPIARRRTAHRRAAADPDAPRRHGPARRRRAGLRQRRRRALRPRPGARRGPAPGRGGRRRRGRRAAPHARVARARTGRSRWTPTCARRAATGRWSGPSTPTPSTTPAGRSRGRRRR